MIELTISRWDEEAEDLDDTIVPMFSTDLIGAEVLRVSEWPDGELDELELLLEDGRVITIMANDFHLVQLLDGISKNATESPHRSTESDDHPSGEGNT